MFLEYKKAIKQKSKLPVILQMFEKKILTDRSEKYFEEIKKQFLD